MSILLNLWSIQLGPPQAICGHAANFQSGIKFVVGLIFVCMTSLVSQQASRSFLFLFETAAGGPLFCKYNSLSVRLNFPPTSLSELIPDFEDVFVLSHCFE